MKKLMLTIGLAAITAIGMFGCQKECNSTCGTIANDGIDLNSNCYWLEIRNNCSGNKKTFCVDQDIWMESFPGERFCITNTTPW